MTGGPSDESVVASATEPTTPGSSSASQSPWRRAGRRFIHQPSGIIGTAIITTYVVMAGAAPLIAPHDPLKLFPGHEMKHPSWQFLLGTDPIGRDIASRVVYGTRPALLVGFVALLIGVALGVSTGLAAGFSRSRIAKGVMRIWDGVFAVPAILIGIILAATFGSGTMIVAAAAGFAASPSLARIARAAVLVEVEYGYVEAARALGLRRSRIFHSHVVPNAMSSVVVQLALAFSGAVLLETALAYLGIGAPPPTPDWGAMLADSHGYLTIAWWYGLFPGLAIVVLVLGLNMVADAARDALDPRLEGDRR